MPRSMAPNIGPGSRHCCARRPTKVAAIALANKIARMAWAMMAKGERYKKPAALAAHGNRHRTRHLLNQEFMQALLLNFRHQGKKAIEKVARDHPGVYLKILALLVPREMQVEHTNRIKQMTDEELDATIELLQGMIDAKLAGANAKLVEEV